MGEMAAAGARLEQLVPGARVLGIAGDGPVEIARARWAGGNAIRVTYRDDHGGTGERMLLRRDESRLRLVTDQGTHTFDGAPDAWLLAAEA
ncbi:hypothetical protein, partial [Frankia sp. Cas3]